MKDQLYNCLTCGYVGAEVGEKDECSDCGEEFTVEESPSGECPDCEGILNNTCPRCGSGYADFGTLETMYGTGGWVNKKEYRADQAKRKAAAQMCGPFHTT